MAFHKVLCPVDFSPGSRDALRVAARIAVESGGPLVLAYVWELSRWTFGQYQLVPATIQGMVDSDEAELARWKLEAQQLGVKEVATRLLTGVAWDQIVMAARDDRSIDLIVMGTHGRTGLPRMLLGSVTEQVVRHAPCAVLVVPPKEDR
jgi:universal stress protein A